MIQTLERSEKKGTGPLSPAAKPGKSRVRKGPVPFFSERSNGRKVFRFFWPGFGGDYALKIGTTRPAMPRCRHDRTDDFFDGAGKTRRGRAHGLPQGGLRRRRRLASAR